MKINKWNNNKKEYEEYNIPDDWKVKTYCCDMDEIVNCVCCGRELPYGFGYTSRRFHTKHGMGYAECEDCYFSYKE